MPHRTKTHGEIMERAKLVVERVKANLQVCRHLFFPLVCPSYKIDASMLTARYP